MPCHFELLALKKVWKKSFQKQEIKAAFEIKTRHQDFAKELLQTYYRGFSRWALVQLSFRTMYQDFQVPVQNDQLIIEASEYRTFKKPPTKSQ